jgi:hypothetical protein
MLLRIVQVLIAAAVVFGCIWFEQSTGYHINPWIIGAWAFMASYGFTLVYDRLSARIGDGGPLAGLGGEERPD